MELFFWSKRSDLGERWQRQLKAAQAKRVELDGLASLPQGAIVLLHWSALDAGQQSQVMQRARELRLVALTDVPNDQEGIRLLQAGFRGYANTFIQGELLVELTRAVGQGDIWAGPQLLQRLLQSLLQQQKKTVAAPVQWSLSEREQQVMEELKRGESNKEIARKLSITERTVKAHVSAILEKANARDRIDLILKANGQVYPH